MEKSKSIMKDKFILYAVRLLPFLLMMTACCSTNAQTPEELMVKGNLAYEAKNFGEAQRLYETALAASGVMRFPEWQFNLGNALYQQQKFTEATVQFNQLADARVSTTLKAASYFNAGNCYLKQKNYAAALAAYKNTLRLNPLDEDARYNLTLVTALMAKNAPAAKVAASISKEIYQPPPEANLTPEEQRRLLDQLNAAENQTLQQRPKKLQQKKKNLKDW